LIYFYSILISVALTICLTDFGFDLNFSILQYASVHNTLKNFICTNKIVKKKYVLSCHLQ